jgi:hypothetical protein
MRHLLLYIWLESWVELSAVYMRILNLTMDQGLPEEEQSSDLAGA